MAPWGWSRSARRPKRPQPRRAGFSLHTQLLESGRRGPRVLGEARHLRSTGLKRDLCAAPGNAGHREARHREERAAERLASWGSLLWPPAQVWPERPDCDDSSCPAQSDVGSRSGSRHRRAVLKILGEMWPLGGEKGSARGRGRGGTAHPRGLRQAPSSARRSPLPPDTHPGFSVGSRGPQERGGRGNRQTALDRTDGDGGHRCSEHSATG